MADKTPEELAHEAAATESSDTFYRYLRVAPADFEDEDTVQVAFSSEYPAQQRASKSDESLGIAKEGELYWEVLSHDLKDIDLSQLNNSGAFLDEHVSTRHLGNVEKAVLSDDRKCRAVLKFDKASKLSKTRKKQIRSSRPHISNGYKHTDYLGKFTLANGQSAHRFAWKPTEISSVADPADPTVGANRAAQMCHCIGCAAMFKRDFLNEEYMCPECADASDPDEDEDEKRTGTNRIFRVKSVKSDRGEMRISYNTLAEDLYKAADKHKQFKTKRDNGDVHSDFRIHDIHHVKNDTDGDTWKAEVYSPAWSSDSKLYVVDFKYDGENLEMGEATESERTHGTKPVEQRAGDKTGQLSRSSVDYEKVDLNILVSGLNPEKKNILRNKLMAEIVTKTPEQEAQLVIDTAETSPHVRKALADKGFIAKSTIEADAKTRSDKFKARNTELSALETEFTKEYGARVARSASADGKKGEPFYLRDKIKILSLEHQSMDDAKTPEEVRMSFRSKVNDLKEGSYLAPNPVDAVLAPDSVAEACDLFECIRRTVAEAKKRGIISTSLMPFDGAEKEANEGIRKQLQDVPGGNRILECGGFTMPANAQSNFRKDGKGAMKRSATQNLTRDFLAGDFGQAGAMIAPEFMPWIDLLRNKIICSELGATFLGGLTGPVVFPRLTAATIAQSVAEGVQLQPFDQVLDQVKLEPHRCGSRQFYSRLALLQPSYDVESLIWNDHSAVIARYIDYMALNGTGAGDQPLGLLNIPGINQIVFGGTPQYQQLINFETQIRKFNVEGNLAFATTSVGRGRLKALPMTLVGSTVVSNPSVAMWRGGEDDGTLLDFKAMATQQIPFDILLAGVFENMLIGMFGGIISIVDNFTRADRDEIALTLNTYFDDNVRHVQAFTRSLDSCNQ